jgi:hypothetical protein
MVSFEQILQKAGNSEDLMQLLENDSQDSSLIFQNSNMSDQKAERQVADFLNEKFDSIESLGDVDSILADLDKSLVTVDEKLRETVREQAYAAENARTQLA